MTDIGALVDLELAKLNGHGDTGALFRRWQLAELIDSANRPPEWLVRGLLIHPTHGQIAGELKTLKSTIANFVAIAIATGEPLFDTFTVDHPGPVLFYVGEGGRDPWTRRMLRIAGAMNVDLLDTPIAPSFDVAPIGSLRFQASLERDLDELEPRLVIIDPLYAFHGTTTAAANLHEEGALLSSVSSMCAAADASLIIVNHFNQTGTGTGLKRITMAGSGEWVDSWILVTHRTPPEVGRGLFHLGLETGSRQWGGTSHILDLDLGTYDPLAGNHDGPITWTLHGTPTSTTDDLARVATIVQDAPLYDLIKEDIAKRLGGNIKRARETVERATTAGLIHAAIVTKADARGSSRKVWCYGPGPDPRTTPEPNVHTGTTPDDDRGEEP